MHINAEHLVGREYHSFLFVRPETRGFDVDPVRAGGKIGDVERPGVRGCDLSFEHKGSKSEHCLALLRRLDRLPARTSGLKHLQPVLGQPQPLRVMSDVCFETHMSEERRRDRRKGV